MKRSLAIITSIAALVFTSIQADEITSAVSVMQPTEGSTVRGTVNFSKIADGIHVKGKITGLTPGKHGFHVHEFGDTSSPDGKAAGGHFNPGADMHGGPMAEHRHAGDLGNIEAGADGVANIDVVDKMLSFDGKGSIVGRGLVVHAKADDLTSQPSGEAGGRVAVGVIGVSKAP